jgi:PPOX class probable F420-dependent enzyme
MATARPGGRPHLTPVWFVWVLDRFWVGTSPDAVKTANLRADPRVSVALEDGNRPLVAEGEARLHDALASLPLAVVDAFSRKYDWTLADEAGGLVVIEMTATKWLRPGGA